VVVFLAGLTGLTVACVEGYVECSEVGPFVREHGPGPGRVGLGPAVSPSGAPVLALRLRFK
jgi:hypothetical protein